MKTALVNAFTIIMLIISCTESLKIKKSNYDQNTIETFKNQIISGALVNVQSLVYSGVYIADKTNPANNTNDNLPITDQERNNFIRILSF